MLRVMTWATVCDDPILSELPYKVETNEWGSVVVSPHRYEHSRYQGRAIALLLELLPDGEMIPECPLKTRLGTKLIDVAWLSPARRALNPPKAAACRVAPDICVEVLSPKNKRAEIEAKKLLYFEKQAGECWICDRQGRMTFFDPAGPLSQSRLCPDFPTQLVLP